MQINDIFRSKKIKKLPKLRAEWKGIHLDNAYKKCYFFLCE